MKTFDLQSYFEKIKIEPVKLSDLDKLNSNVPNEFGITSKDMIGDIAGFPIGVVIRIIEEQENQGNKPDIKVFQKDRFANEVTGGFNWSKTKNGMNFWGIVIGERKFDFFYNHYSEYKKYDDSITEKIQINPISVSDLDKLNSNVPNEFGITSKDMIGDLAGFPIGVVVRMMEEQEKHGKTCKPDIKVFQQNRCAGSGADGFLWADTEDGHNFWSDVISHKDYDKFFKKYPEYKKYNDSITEKIQINPISVSDLDELSSNVPNKFGITSKDMIGSIKGFPVGVVVKMMEEQEKQRNNPDITVFQERKERDIDRGGFHWKTTEDGQIFWEIVIMDRKFDEFYKKYPEYKKYDDHDINEKLNIPEISLSQLDEMDNTPSNPFGITKKDLVGAIQEYPIAIIIKALEEEKRQRGDHISNKELLDVLYEYGFGGAFDWSSSKEGYNFWARISRNKNFDEFYEKYPEYKKYDC